MSRGGQDGLMWAAASVVMKNLERGAGGTTKEEFIDLIKRWHVVCRDTRDCARSYARSLLVCAHAEPEALARALEIISQDHSVQKLEVSVWLQSEWKLDPELNALSESEIGKLNKIPTRILRVKPGHVEPAILQWRHAIMAPSSNGTVSSKLNNCIAIHNIVNFNSLHAVGAPSSGEGDCVRSAVRKLSVDLAGNLRQLECGSDVWLQHHELVTDWCSHLTGLEELRLYPHWRDAPAYTAIGQLPQLRKMVCSTSTEQGWRELCKLTQLHELHVTCAIDETDATKLYELWRLRHLQIYIVGCGKLRTTDFVAGIFENMPNLEVLSVLSRLDLRKLLKIDFPIRFRHTRLRRVSFKGDGESGAASHEEIQTIRRWCPNLEEIIVDGRVTWRKVPA